MRVLIIALTLGSQFLLPACHRKRSAKPAHAGVMAYLMPAGKDRVELLLERVKSGPGKRTLRQPRMLVEIRTDSGVVYRIREKISDEKWRTAAQIFLEARPDGAWITRQLNVHGKRVGPREPRLVFGWPMQKGTSEHRFAYPIYGRRRDGGRRVVARVRTLRSGFHETVGGKKVGPCLEVEERLKPDVGGELTLRSVYCQGLGRVRIRQENRTLSRGVSFIVDQVIGARSPKK